jgi:hypothetical protein
MDPNPLTVRVGREVDDSLELIGGLRRHANRDERVEDRDCPLHPALELARLAGDIGWICVERPANEDTVVLGLGTGWVSSKRAHIALHGNLGTVIHAPMPLLRELEGRVRPRGCFRDDPSEHALDVAVDPGLIFRAILGPFRRVEPIRQRLR